MKLNDAQQRTIREHLVQQGLTFKPLFDEIYDHVSTDLEERMSTGVSFDDAWRDIVGALSENHFINIQQTTMETISTRYKISQGISLMTLGLLLVSMLLKLMHLPGANLLLLISLAALICSLLIGSFTGIYMNRQRRGAARVLGVIGGMVLLTVGFSFKLLHLAGADQFVVAGVLTSIVAFFINTFHVFQHASGEESMFTYLHEKYTPGIERFFIVILVPHVLYRIYLDATGNGIAANFILLIVLFGAGVQLISLGWRSMERDLSRRTPVNATLLATSFLCLSIVFMGPIVPLNARIIMIIIYSIASAWLAMTMENNPSTLSKVAVAIPPIIFTMWGLMRLWVLPLSLAPLIFNVFFVVLLSAGVLVCRKHEIMRAYMIISLASYLFEYIA